MPRGEAATLATPADNAALEKLLRGGPLNSDDWAMEAELRGVQRLISTLGARGANAGDWGGIPARHDSPPQHQPAAAGSAGATGGDAFHASYPRSQAVAWIALSLGLAVFACGAVLLGWSIAAGRDELWAVGLPLALAGQAGLVVGLILQLDGLSHANRQTAQALSNLDGELQTVRQATTLLTTTKSNGAQSFYLHLAEGANPHLLLADLKGQMDLLVQQMAQQRRP